MIKINISIRHKGKDFPEGSVITDADMGERSQARLVEKGVAEFVESAEKPKKGKKDDA